MPVVTTSYLELRDRSKFRPSDLRPPAVGLTPGQTAAARAESLLLHGCGRTTGSVAV